MLIHVRNELSTWGGGGIKITTPTALWKLETTKQHDPNEVLRPESQEIARKPGSVSGH